jgi:two-component system, NtrC family, sensor histidine kinase PilS
MEASVRTPLPYPELSLAPEERIPQSFWTSLRYFNLYRMVLAGIFLGTTLLYGDAFNLGFYSLEIFRYVAAAYLFCSVVLQGVLRDLRDKFELQLSVQACLDIVAITLLMWASGGMRSGLGVMLLISLTAASIVAPRRLAFLYAALGSIALLLEQSYWVLQHDAPTASFLQPGLLAIAFFATAGVTSWLAARVAANERLARLRGRQLATQTRVNQLVIEDMQDGVLVLDRAGRVVQHNPQAQQLLGGGKLIGAALSSLVSGHASADGARDIQAGGRDLRLPAWMSCACGRWTAMSAKSSP